MYAKNGRFGPYVQLGDADTLPPDEKPKMASLFQTMTLERSRSTTPSSCCRCRARSAPTRPTARDRRAANGRYGPFVKKGEDTAAIDTEEQLLTVTARRGAGAPRAAPAVPTAAGAPKPPLRELGTDPVSGKPIVVKDGRFGLYVTDGETNAIAAQGRHGREDHAERAAELLPSVARPAGEEGREEGTREEGRGQEAGREEGGGEEGTGEEGAGQEDRGQEGSPDRRGLTASPLSRRPVP